LEVLIAVLTPLAALIGSYLGSRLTSAHQLRLERRVETAETILAMLYELQDDFHLWLAPYPIVGRPTDKLTEGQLFNDKLNRLRGYRRMRAVWLDPWLRPEAIQMLDATIGQLGRWSADYFNALPKNPHGQIPEGSPYPEVRERLGEWLGEGLPEALREIESELGRGLTSRTRWRRMLGE
jgi:hypothetical protein